MPANETVFTKDLENKKFIVVRSFDAPLDAVWKAWTQAELLDQWWAPRPYRAETKTMDFREGGIWLYCMVGPEGDRQWCRVDYLEIKPQKSIRSTDGFCDETGVKTSEIPEMKWFKEFSESGNQTRVSTELSFDSVDDLEKIAAMGFEEGFKAGLENLAELFATGKGAAEPSA